MKNKILISSILATVIGTMTLFTTKQQINNIQEASAYNALSSTRTTPQQDLAGANELFDNAYDEALASNGGDEAAAIATAKTKVLAEDPARSKWSNFHTDPNWNNTYTQPGNHSVKYKYSWTRFNKNYGLDYSVENIEPGTFMQENLLTSNNDNLEGITGRLDRNWVIPNPGYLYFDKSSIGSDQATFVIDADKSVFPLLDADISGGEATGNGGGVSYISKNPKSWGSAYGGGIILSSYEHGHSTNPNYGVSDYSWTTYPGENKGGYGGIKAGSDIVGAAADGTAMMQLFEGRERGTETWAEISTIGNNKVQEIRLKDDLTLKVDGLKPETLYQIVIKFPLIWSGQDDYNDTQQVASIAFSIVFKTTPPVSVRAIQTLDNEKLTITQEVPGELSLHIPDLLLMPYYLTDGMAINDSPDQIKTAKLINKKASDKTLDLTDDKYWESGETMVGDHGTFYQKEIAPSEDNPALGIDTETGNAIYENGDGAAEAGDIYKVEGDTVNFTYDDLGITPATTYDRGDIVFRTTSDGQYGLENPGNKFSANITNWTSDKSVESFTTIKDKADTPTFTQTNWAVNGQTATKDVTINAVNDNTKEDYEATSVEFFSSDANIMDKLNAGLVIENESEVLVDGKYIEATYKIKYTGTDEDAGLLLPSFDMIFKGDNTAATTTTVSVTNSSAATFGKLAALPIGIKSATPTVDYRSANVEFALENFKSPGEKYKDPSNVKFKVLDSSDNVMTTTQTYTDLSETGSVSITGLEPKTKYDLKLVGVYNDGYTDGVETEPFSFSFTTKDLEEAAAPAITATTTSTDPTKVDLSYTINTTVADDTFYKAIINKATLTGTGIDAPIELTDFTDGSHSITVEGLEGSTEYTDWNIKVEYDNGRGETKTENISVNSGSVITANKALADAPVIEAESIGSGHGGRIDYTITDSEGTDSKWGSKMKSVTATTSNADATISVSETDSNSGSVLIGGLMPSQTYNGIATVTYEYINEWDVNGNEKSTATFSETYDLETMNLIGVDVKPSLTSSSFEAESETAGTLSYEINVPKEDISASTPTAKGTIRKISIVDETNKTVYGTTDYADGSKLIETGDIELTGLPAGEETAVKVIVDYDSEDKPGSALDPDEHTSVNPGEYDLIDYELANLNIKTLENALEPEVTTSIELIDDDAEDTVLDNDWTVNLTYNVKVPTGDSAIADTELETLKLTGTDVSSSTIIDENGNTVNPEDLLSTADGLDHVITITNTTPVAEIKDWKIEGTYKSATGAVPEVKELTGGEIESFTPLDAPQPFDVEDAFNKFELTAEEGTGTEETLNYNLDYELNMPSSETSSTSVITKAKIVFEETTGTKAAPIEIPLEGEATTKGSILVEGLSWNTNYTAKIVIEEANFFDGVTPIESTPKEDNGTIFKTIDHIDNATDEFKPKLNVTTGKVTKNSIKVDWTIEEPENVDMYDRIDENNLKSTAYLFEGTEDSSIRIKDGWIQKSNEQIGFNGSFEFTDLNPESQYYIIVETTYNGVVSTSDVGAVNSDSTPVETSSGFSWYWILIIILILLFFALAILIALFWTTKWAIVKATDRKDGEATFLLNKKDSKLKEIEGRKLTSNEVKEIKYVTSKDDKNNLLITLQGVKGFDKLTNLIFLADATKSKEAAKANEDAKAKYEAELASWNEAKAKAKEAGTEFTTAKPAKPATVKVEKDIKLYGFATLVKEEKVKAEKIVLAKDVTGAEAQVKELENQLAKLEEELVKAQEANNEEKVVETETKIVTVKNWLKDAKKNLVTIKQKTSSKASVMIDKD